MSSSIPTRAVTIAFALAIASQLGLRPANAAPAVDLADSTPRAVLVAFEISPHDAPYRLDQTYTPFLPGRLAPGVEPGLVEIRVAGELIERHVLVRPDPIPGSFSDFVWVFDARSGAVVSATVSGEVRTLLDFGIARASARAKIRAEMDTQRSSGFRPPKNWLGETLFRACSPEGAGRHHARGCTAVESQRYDRSRGYVNAVGELAVRTSLGMELRTFSPLGEAIFSEVVGVAAFD